MWPDAEVEVRKSMYLLQAAQREEQHERAREQRLQNARAMRPAPTKRRLWTRTRVRYT